MSKIVITGGAGFIGSHIAERCAKAGHEVVIVDNLDDYYSPELKKVNIDCVFESGNATFVHGDITDLKFLRTVIGNDTDYVFHEAAQAGVRISVENPFKPNKVNVFGTLNVLQASLDAEVERVINASSSFTGKMFNNEPITIFGDGNQTRDFTYIEDIVRENMKILDTNKADGKVMNIGSGNRISVNDLAKNLMAIIGSSSVITYAETQKGDAEHTLADVRMAKELVGYEPKVNIEEGLKRFVEWYSDSGGQIWVQ